MNAGIPIVAAVLLGASLTLRAQTAAPAAPQPTGTLDSARRDLQSLPARSAADQALRERSTPGGGAALPGLTDPLTSPTSPSSQASGQSATWLQDTMDTVETRRGASQRLARTPDGAFPAEKNGAPPTSTPADPLVPFLTQWLSPRDQQLVRPADNRQGLLNDAPGQLGLPSPADHPGSGPERVPVLPSPEAASPLPQNIGALPLVSKNPYLEALSTPLDAPVQDDDNKELMKAVPAATGGPFSGRSSVLQTTLAPMVTPAPDAPQVAGAIKPVAPVDPYPSQPTAPVVNDRKYFPQLRRF